MIRIRKTPYKARVVEDRANGIAQVFCDNGLTTVGFTMSNRQYAKWVSDGRPDQWVKKEGGE